MKFISLCSAVVKVVAVSKRRRRFTRHFLFWTELCGRDVKKCRSFILVLELTKPACSWASRCCRQQLAIFCHLKTRQEKFAPIFLAALNFPAFGSARALWLLSCRAGRGRAWQGIQGLPERGPLKEATDADAVVACRSTSAACSPHWRGPNKNDSVFCMVPKVD